MKQFSSSGFKGTKWEFLKKREKVKPCLLEVKLINCGQKAKKNCIYWHHTQQFALTSYSGRNGEESNWNRSRRIKQVSVFGVKYSM